MPYITREDGEHFVIPSYRDVLSAKQKSVLKKDIFVLSQSYGEYITLQKKGPSQYEVAFSPDTGYLLGESIWHQFKRPLDMIYCEAIPNTTEAILVIVKAGSVYLDGSFPLDSIPEELIIFLTQQNNFEIYIYGDVPISQTPEPDKFSFDSNSVKSFTILDKPVFATLPLLKIYQLQPVEYVLKVHGIGVFPTKQLLMGFAVVALAWMLWSYLSKEKVVVAEAQPEVNPYQIYNATLASPEPSQEISQFVEAAKLFFAMPGWEPVHFEYALGVLTVSVQSSGGTTQDLFQWATDHNSTVNIEQNGISVIVHMNFPNRPLPKTIYPIKEVLGTLVDRVALVYPGNNLKLDAFDNKGMFTDVNITITVSNVSPAVVALIGNQLKDLPLALHTIAIDVNNGNLTGNIIIHALGS